MEASKAVKSSGKAFRQGITLVELMDMFADEKAATEWFESVRWGAGRCCSKCGSERTGPASHRKMPYWCSDCRSYFSVRTGTPIAHSKIPLRKWAIAIHLCVTSLKSISSMQLHRDIGVSQPAAWFMLMRIREAWRAEAAVEFSGPVEVDETYMGGKRKNMPKRKREQLTGRGAVGKTAVAGAKDRATNQVVAAADKQTLQEFVTAHTDPGATVYTDEAAVYEGLPRTHEAVRHSVGEYVRNQASTNCVESFWSTLKRAHEGTFHKISPKHLDRYVREFAGRHNVRNLGTLSQMRDTVARMVGRNLLYRELVADNGLSSAARS